MPADVQSAPTGQTAVTTNTNPSQQGTTPPSSSGSSADSGGTVGMGKTSGTEGASSTPGTEKDSTPLGQTPPDDLTATTGIDPPLSEQISVDVMFYDADPIVQLVMVLLVVASLITWGIILEKFFLLRKASLGVMLFKKTVIKNIGELKKSQFHPFLQQTVATGIQEAKDIFGQETRCDYRERVERAMRMEMGGMMDHLSRRVVFLATVGSISPFVGLFGTVYGIMSSFMGIAASGETSLAVVAPGIAEALFATALGLVAAIPAVIAYNKTTATLKKITKEALTAISILGNHLAHDHFQKLEKKVTHATPKPD